MIGKKKQVIWFFIFIVGGGIITAANTLTEHERVLILFPWWGKYLGGLSTHHFNNQKMFIEHGVYTATLSLKNVLAEKLVQMNMPVEVSKNLMTKDEILQACQQHAITAVITPDLFLISALKKIAEFHPIKIIFMRHATVDDQLQENIRELKDIDCALGVNPTIVGFIEQANKDYNLGIRHIAWMPPFWDEESCKTIALPFADKTTFFSERFGLTISNDALVLCEIANLVPGKNHSLLLRALKQILSTRDIDIHLIFAGEGVLRPEIEHEIKTLGLDGRVHLIGSIPDVPALLNYCDIHVLPSIAEGFPLANMEAAYLKKAIITTAGTGAACLIEDGISGLLFENNNEESLKNVLEQLIDDSQLRLKLGENAYTRMSTHFTNEMIFRRWKNILFS
ncbi:MAG TPA: glycosyltransferase family 4 protein [Candidatus Babeliales bacterium]|nr:glycosyltransferase family 4 protein [Candidatus Babeliales bacterium]